MADGITICFACKRLKGDTCEAFPGGIPDEILYGGFDHRKPFPGDNGVRFEMDPDREADLATYEKLVRLLQ